MHLALSIPPYEKEVHAQVELRPNKLSHWLSDLPLLNISQSSQSIFDALAATNRMSLDDKTRMKLMETYREPVARVCTELNKSYLGKALPLSGNALMAAQRAREFQAEMAHGYKRIILHTLKASGDNPGRSARVTLAIAIQRAIRYLGETQLRSYQCYQSPPKGVWRETHNLYALAEKHGIHALSVDDPLNSTIKQSSIEHVYKQALLVTLANPYHLPPHSIGQVQHYLSRWASLAVLGDAKMPGKNCQFLIDLEVDRVGELYVPSEATISNHSRFRLLDTVTLARKLHEQLSLLQHNKQPETEGLHADFFAPTHTREFIHQLLNSWGVIPKRAFGRNRKQGAALEAAMGLNAIHYWLNSGEDFILSSEFVGPMPKKKTNRRSRYLDTTAFDAAANIDINDQGTEIATTTNNPTNIWTVINEGAGGLAISCSNVQGQVARIGDLVATRSNKHGTWEINTTRWIKSAQNGHIEMGIKRISPTALPVMVKYLDENKKERDFIAAIHLPQLAALKQKAALIAPRGIFRSGREITLDDSYRRLHMRCRQLIEVTALYEHFEIEEL